MSFPLGVAIMFAAAALSPTAAAQAKVFGLFVGIDSYPGGRELPNCVHDAQDMRDLLIRRGVPKENLVLLPERQCTRGGILRGLRDLAKRAQPEGEALVFFSGHGSQVRDQNGDEEDGADETWVTIDLEHITDDELEKAFAAIPGKVFVLSDSCHSGTVSKDIELGDSSDDLRKYLAADEIAECKERGEGAAFTPRDVTVERRHQQERQNASGGAYSATAGVGGRVRLFAACSDHEFSNASRRQRNSAFTAELLGVLEQAQGRGLQFGPLRELVTARIRSRAFRYPQNPALFEIAATEAVPSWLGRQADAVQASPAQRTSALAEAAQRQLRSVIEGLWRREDVAPGERREWITAFKTKSGEQQAKTGDSLVLHVQASKTAPQATWLCVVNVGPTGNLTLLYPNAYDGNEPLAPGGLREIGTKEAKLTLNPPSGEESFVAFALEWDPFAGFDFAALADTDHMFLSTAIEGRSTEATRGALMRSRDVSVARRRGRAGEGWDRAVLTVRHR